MRRLGLLGDAHLGTTWDGIARFDEQRMLLDAILNFGVHEGWEAAAFLGDIYDSPRPTPEVYAYFFDLLRRFGERKIHVYLLRGNHDGSEALRGGHALVAANHLEQHNLVTVISDPARITEIPALALPHGSSAPVPPSEIVWGFCHHDLEGGVVGSEGRMIRGGASPLSAGVRDYTTVRHWFAGHLHTPQDLPKITVLGSLLQLDRNEEGQEKRIITLDCETGKAETHPLVQLGASQFKTFDLDFVSDEEKARAQYQLLTQIDKFPVKSLVSVNVRIPAGQEFDATGLEDRLRKTPNVVHLRRIVPEVVIPEVRRIPTVVVEKTPKEAVMEFVTNTVAERHRDKIIETAFSCMERAI